MNIKQVQPPKAQYCLIIFWCNFDNLSYTITDIYKLMKELLLELKEIIFEMSCVLFYLFSQLSPMEFRHCKHRKNAL
jgi:hypothetical protein